MLKKEPVVAIGVFNSILAFAIHGEVQLLDDLGTNRLGFVEVRFHIVDADSKTLGSVAQGFREPGLAVRA